MQPKYPGISLNIFCFLVFALGSGLVDGHGHTQQFKDWYPQFARVFEHIKNENCHNEYQRYLTGNKTGVEIDFLGGADHLSVLAQPVITCLLDNTSEFVKGSMTGGQVLLGVMPTVLAFLGASSEEMATLANIGRRPLLALILAIGSPSAYLSRAFEFSTSSDILDFGENRRIQRPIRRTRYKITLSVFEYSIASAAAANVAILCWQLGTRSVSTLWANLASMQIVWVAGGIGIHILGTIVLRLRLRGWRDTPPRCYISSREGLKESDKDRRERQYSAASGVKDETERFRVSTKRLYLSGKKCFASGWKWLVGVWQRVNGLRRTEFLPSASDNYEVRIVTAAESKRFLVAAWLHSTFTILHVVFGTLAFSSLLFMGARDALSVVGRFVGSVLICRIILMYEIAGLRERCRSIDREDIPDRSSMEGLGVPGSDSSEQSSGTENKTVRDANVHVVESV